MLAELLKHRRDVISHGITELFNYVVENNNFLDTWAEGLRNCIFKTGLKMESRTTDDLFIVKGHIKYQFSTGQNLIVGHVACTQAFDRVNSLRPRPSKRHFEDDIFKCIFEN